MAIIRSAKAVLVQLLHFMHCHNTLYDTILNSEE
jgi:hypothetical protein